MFSLNFLFTTTALVAVTTTLVHAQTPPFDKHLTDTKLPFVVHKATGSSNPPLLFYLHDQAHDGPGSDIVQHVIKSGPGLRLEDGAEGIVNAGGVKPVTQDMTTVMPLASEGTSSWNLDEVKEVLTFMRTSGDYKFDTTKVFLSGLGMGATAIWDLVIQNPQLASVATMINGQPSQGSSADFSALAKSNLPIQHYVGENESTAKAVQSALTKAGATNVKLNDQGAGINLDNIFDGAWTQFMESQPGRQTVAPTSTGGGGNSGNGTTTTATPSSGGTTTANGSSSSNSGDDNEEEEDGCDDEQESAGSTGRENIKIPRDILEAAEAQREARRLLQARRLLEKEQAERRDSSSLFAEPVVQKRDRQQQPHNHQHGRRQQAGKARRHRGQLQRRSGSGSKRAALPIVKRFF